MLHIPSAVPDVVPGITPSFASAYNVTVDGLIKRSGPCYCRSKTSICVSKGRCFVKGWIWGLKPQAWLGAFGDGVIREHGVFTSITEYCDML